MKPEALTKSWQSAVVNSLFVSSVELPSKRLDLLSSGRRLTKPRNVCCVAFSILYLFPISLKQYGKNPRLKMSPWAFDLSASSLTNNGTTHSNPSAPLTIVGTRHWSLWICLPVTSTENKQENYLFCRAITWYCRYSMVDWYVLLQRVCRREDWADFFSIQFHVRQIQPEAMSIHWGQDKEQNLQQRPFQQLGRYL